MNYIKYILFGATLLLASSCGNDWLNIEPSNKVQTETSLKTLKELNFTLNGIYSKMQNSDGYSGRIMYYGDVTADDMQANGDTKRTSSYYLYKYNKTNAPSTFWRIPYEIIRNANIILTKIEDIPLGDGSEENEAYMKEVKGQALALRALALFDLTRFYGVPYAKDQGKSWGAAIVKDVTGIDSKPKRNTVAECYTEIISDLKDAVTLLKTKHNPGKINRWGAMTLLSRVYLYKGDKDGNTAALATAKEAIEGAKKAGYSLWTNEEYTDAWTDDNSARAKELFFEIVNLTVDGPGKEGMGYLCSDKGYYDMIPTSSFISMLQSDKKDVRNNLFGRRDKKDNKKFYYYCDKYHANADESIADANIPMFRMSELYLNAAEAAVKLNDNDNAVLYLDPIVKRANPANTVAGTTVTLDRVLLERRKELAGEGHRLFDAMRNNQIIERKDAKIDAKNKHLTLTDETKKFDWNFYKIILPIPKFEMDTNPNMADQQNPGY